MTRRRSSPSYSRRILQSPERRLGVPDNEPPVSHLAPAPVLACQSIFSTTRFRVALSSRLRSCRAEGEKRTCFTQRPNSRLISSEVKNRAPASRSSRASSRSRRASGPSSSSPPAKARGSPALAARNGFLGLAAVLDASSATASRRLISWPPLTVIACPQSFSSRCHYRPPSWNRQGCQGSRPAGAVEFLHPGARCPRRGGTPCPC